MSNSVSAWAATTTHCGVQWTWDRKSAYLPLFDACSSADPDSFLRAELLRWCAKFVSSASVKMGVLKRALERCPLHFLVWRDVAALVRNSRGLFGPKKAQFRPKMTFKKYSLIGHLQWFFGINFYTIYYTK